MPNLASEDRHAQIGLVKDLHTFRCIVVRGQGELRLILATAPGQKFGRNDRSSRTARAVPDGDPAWAAVPG